MGTRVGVRPYRTALEIELRNDGHSDAEIEQIISTKITQKRISYLDWNDLFDVSYGYISQVTEGRILMMPTFQSCIEYLDKFEILRTS
jgi:hypothetical protein